MNRKSIILGAAASVMFLLLAGCSGTAAATALPSTPCNVNCVVPTQSNLRTLSVNGEGIVKVAPDIATIYLSVITQDPSISKSWDDNNAKATAAVAAIEGLGVKAEDIQSDFTVTQQDKYDPVSGKPTGETDYFVTHSLTVTARDFNQGGRHSRRRPGGGCEFGRWGELLAKRSHPGRLAGARAGRSRCHRPGE